jgi:hypothetical protein
MEQVAIKAWLLTGIQSSPENLAWSQKCDVVPAFSGPARYAYCFTETTLT